MTATARQTRRVHSLKTELLEKAREATLSAIQAFNNPLVRFKSETFIVLMIIAWTYLMHAYYRDRGVEYRYFRRDNKGRRRFDRTARGTFKYWDLERCINDDACPLDKPTRENLRFLIGLRHEIEHQMSLALDTYLSGRYQACALNFNRCIKELFGERYALEPYLTFNIQFAELATEQVEEMTPEDALPPRIRTYIADFDQSLAEEEFNSQHYSYRVLFVRKLTGKRGQADRVVEFISAESPLAAEIDKQYWVQKEVERPKHRAKDVVEAVRGEGFLRFNMYHHTHLWKSKDAKNPGKGYGVEVAGTWYWYERWLDVVLQHCRENAKVYLSEHTEVEPAQAVPAAPRDEVPSFLKKDATE